MDCAASRLAGLSRRLGRPVEIDGAALLGERAALAGFSRQGSLTVGGAGRMVRTADGWIVLQLARDSDWEAMPALTGAAINAGDWASVERALAQQPSAEVVETGRLLGLAIASCSQVAQVPATNSVGAVGRRAGGSAAGAKTASGLRVVDLSALWAGPLCAHLLGLAGAHVTKVEDPRRRDGARRGPRAFYNLLHDGHDEVEIDFASPAGRDELRRLISAADVVIESSRPRAMEQLGIDPDHIADGPMIWLSITAYGRTGPLSNAVGFGDDAAAAAGVWLPAEQPGERPHFVGDALADPVTGLAAAVAVLEAVEAGGGQWIDMGLCPTVRNLLKHGEADGEQAALDAPHATVECDSNGQWIVVTDELSVPVAPPRARRP
jgi:CoA-transferase family III